MFALANSDYIFLFGAATLAGFVDAIAGGGGLITLPALLLTGVPNVASLATNKFQSSFGTFTASTTMIRKGVISIPEVKFGFLAAFIGGTSGAIVVRQVNSDALDNVIPVVLVVIAGYFLFNGTSSDIEREARLSDRAYQGAVVVPIGFYDGFFGPGTGSFFAMSGVSLRGLHLVRSTAFAKVMNFGSNVSSLLVFTISGDVWFKAGTVMLCGQIIGATVGSHTVLIGGTKIIRPLIVTVSVLMLVRFFLSR